MSVELPADVEMLQAIVAAQTKTINRLNQQLTELTAQSPARQQELEAIIVGLQKQLENAQSGTDTTTTSGNGGSQRRNNARRRVKDEDRKPQTGHGPNEQLALQVEVDRYEIPEDDQICLECGGDLRATGQTEDSELIDVVDIRFLKRKVERAKYVCRCVDCAKQVTAPGPEDRLIDGGRYSVDFGVKVVIDKYISGLSLHNIAKRMRRADLEVTTATLWDQTLYIAQLLGPTSEAVRHQILQEDVIGIDQTGWRLLIKGKKKHQIWALTSPTATYFRFAKDKSTETGLELLGDYPGTIVCDGLSTHQSIVNHIATTGRAPPQLAGCWAHARAKFQKCESDFPEATPILDDFDELFGLEREHRRREGESEDDYHRRILEVRQNQSKPIVERIGATLRAYRPPPGASKLAFAKAVAYTLKRWDALNVFLDDPAVWLDNNRTERALRQPVVGRKIHLGSKSKRGMWVASVLYTLTQTALVQGVNPAAYLREAIIRAKRQPGTITLPEDLTLTDAE
jgi:transposase